MKFRYYFAMAAAALVMTNCSNEEDALQTINDSKSFTATIEGASRSAVDSETGAFSWTDGDKISVWTADGFDTYVNSSTDVNTFTFAAQDENDTQGTAKDYAIYPAGNHGISGSEITINLPAEYAYGSTNMPMLATVENGNSNLSFKHLAGVMRFVVKNVPVGATKFIFTTTNDILTGNYVVDSEGEIKKDSEGTLSGNNSVTITFDALGAAQNMTFYVPMPVGTYGEYKVQIENAEDNLGLTHTSEGVTNTIGRRTLLLMPEFTVEDDGLKKGAGSTIEVTQSEEVAISGNQSLTIDATGVSDASATLALNYTPQEGNATLALSDGSEYTESQSSVAKVQINPEGDIPVESLNLNTPTLTVELGEGTYGTVEALTATQTLIIGEGVTIETLILNGGALQVAEGATINNIVVKDEAGLRSAVAVGGNIELQSNIDLNLTSSTALTIESGKTVSIDLNTFTLTTSTAEESKAFDDITIKGNLSVVGEGTIETANTAFYVVGGDLSLKACTIESERTGCTTVYANGGKVTAENVTANVASTAFLTTGATMTLTDCKVTKTDGSTTAVTATNKGNLTINGGEYKSEVNTASHDESYVIGVKGGSTATINTTVSGGNGGVTVYEGSTVYFTGGNYTGNKAGGLYVAGQSVVTYENCTFSGEEADVVVGTDGGKINEISYAEGTKINWVSEPDELNSIITNGGYAVLAANIDLNLTSSTALTIESGKTVSIDLNTFTLTTSTAEESKAFDDITIKGNLSVVGEGTIETANTAFYVVGGDLSLKACTIESERTGCTTVYANGGKVTVENVTANVASTAFLTTGATMTLTDCNVTKTDGSTTAVTATNQGNLTISGGEYKSEVNAASHDESYVIGVKGGSTATINTTVSGGNGGVTVYGGSTVNFTGGSYIGEKACGLYVAEASTVTYTSNCTFSGKEADTKVADSGSSLKSKVE